jgi:vacuolar-type H+-ATPase subunit H
VEILDLVNSLEELIVQARRLPVGGNLVLDRKRMLDIVDQMRLAVPADVREATQILDAREQLLDDASRSARGIVERAEEDRGRLIEENSVVRAAHERSQALIMDAETRARQMLAEADSTVAAHLSEAAEAASKQLDDADQYALEVLRRLENQLQAFLESIRMSILSLQDRR